MSLSLSLSLAAALFATSLSASEIAQAKSEAKTEAKSEAKTEVKQAPKSPSKLSDVIVTSNRIQGLASKIFYKEQIDEELIFDSKDLVRYQPDVGLADNGRHLRGFAIRGVEGNRVGISIDGVSMPAYEDNSLYGRYGNFNTARPAIDPELVRAIEVDKGADSFNYGSGNLGGGVNYKTLGVRNLVKPGESFGGLIKTAYSSKNRELLGTLALGFDTKYLEGAFLYSKRNGREVKPKSTDNKEKANARSLADPVKNDFHSALFKLVYKVNENNRLGYSISLQNNRAHIKEHSYSLIMSYARDADDISRRATHNLFYELDLEDMFLTLFRIDLDYQKVKMKAYNLKYYTDPVLDTSHEVDNRLMQSDMKRLRLRFDSDAINLLGAEHTFSLKAAYAMHSFTNKNVFTYITWKRDRNTGATSNYKVSAGKPSSIQPPVKGKEFNISLIDSVEIGDDYSLRLGLRYDKHKLIPLKPKFNCPTCSSKIKAVSFSGLSGLLGMDAKLQKGLIASLDLSTGYRVPSHSELFFTWSNSANSWIANPKLKAEKAYNIQAGLKGKNDLGEFSIAIYTTMYKDFLQENSWLERVKNPYYTPPRPGGGGGGSSWWYGRDNKEYNETLHFRMENFQRARVMGFELYGKLLFDSFGASGFWADLSTGFSKGKAKGGISILAIPTFKLVAGLGYKSELWGLSLKYTHQGSKKPRTAMQDNYAHSWKTGYKYEQRPFPYLSKRSNVFDLQGFVSYKNFTLRAGLYNVFNQKYNTWDRLRGINTIGTTNTVDRSGKGLPRFNEPGRNFTVSLQYKF